MKDICLAIGLSLLFALSVLLLAVLGVAELRTK